MKEIYSVQLEDEDADALLEITKLIEGSIKGIPFSDDIENDLSKASFMDDLAFWYEDTHVVGILFIYTDIERLPDCIGNFKHLKFLTIFSSKIQYIPTDLKKLRQLECLELCNEFLDIIVNIEFPNIFQFLNKLKIIRIRGRIEIYFPSSFTKLINLEELTLELCLFFTNHAQFMRYKNERMRYVKELREENEILEKLYSIYKNYRRNISELPKDIDKLISLKKLTLEDLNETVLPSSIVKLPNLKELNLLEVDIINIEIIFKIRSLEILTINQRYLEKIPKDLLEKTGLEIESY